MKYWNVEVTATVGGYISVNAKDKEEAEKMVSEHVGHMGLDAFAEKLYHNTQKKYADFVSSEITHRENLIYPELVSENPYDRELVIGDKKYNPNTRKWKANEEARYGDCEDADAEARAMEERAERG